MNRIEKTITLPKDTVDKYNRLLDMEEVDFEKEGIDEDSTIETYTFKFGNGFEADIKVCSGQHNLFVDPVLFNNGHECCVAEPNFVLDGETWFEYDGIEYVAVIKVA